MKKILFSLYLLGGGAAITFGQSLAWVDSASTYSGYQQSSSIAVDNNGNIYVAGYFQTALYFSDVTLRDSSSCGNHKGAYLAKYNSSGNLLWAKEVSHLYRTNSGCPINSIKLDKSGNIVMTGYITDSVSIGPYILHSPVNKYLVSNCFIARFDTAGKVIWVKQTIASGSGFAQGDVITTDNLNNIYVAGIFMDTLFFGTFKMISKGPEGLFLTKYDSSGNFLWAKQAYNADTGVINAASISVSAIGKGSICITGCFTGTLILGSDSLKTPYCYACPQNFDAFVAKYDTSGNVIWDKQSLVQKGQSTVWVSSGTMDNDGNTYITGGMTDTVYFGTYQLINNSNLSNGQKVFLVKYDTAGNVIWAKISSGRMLCAGNYLYTDNHNHIYLSVESWQGDSLLFGDYKFVSPHADSNTSYSYLMMLNPSGNVLCASSLIYRLGIISASDTGGKYIYAVGTGYSTSALTVQKWNPCTSYLGTPEIEVQNDEVILYPNPATSHIIIKSSIPFSEYNNIMMTDITGRKQTFMKEIINRVNQMVIDISSLACGMYFITLENKDKITTCKFIKE